MKPAELAVLRRAWESVGAHCDALAHDVALLQAELAALLAAIESVPITVQAKESDGIQWQPTPPPRETDAEPGSTLSLAGYRRLEHQVLTAIRASDRSAFERWMQSARQLCSEDQMLRLKCSIALDRPRLPPHGD